LICHRNQNNIDIANASDDHGVIIMDFSQNLTLPSVSETPSQWYFLSLVSVSCFGIYYVNKEMQYSYIYQENVAGKGSDEVNSLLHHFIRTVVCSNGHKRLSIYADNCGGQNKNNFVVRLLLASVHMGTLERVDLNFFVKGHTKNAVDRGFAHIRKKASRADIWTWDHMVEIVNSIKNTAVVPIERENSIFHQYKSMVNDLYKPLSGIKQYQLFSMTSDAPGTVSCRVGPDSTPLVQDIRRRFDGIFTDDTKVCVMFDEHLEPLPPPPVNSEKKQDMYNKVRPYVPEEFVNDPLYDAPNDAEEVEAKAVKRDRRTRSKAAKSKKPSSVEENNAEGTAQAVATACPDTEQNAEGVSCDVAAQAKQADLPRKRARKASK
jgi:hypothetical protein